VKIGPCALAAVLIHPTTSHNIVNRLLWAFCVYLEAVSVLPQLRVMQNTRVCSDLAPLVNVL
jgi:ER lumen protein retaining receptor